MVNVQVSLSAGDTKSRGIFPVKTDRPRKKFTDREVQDLMEHWGSASEYGRQSVHQQLKKTWFVNLVAFAGMQNIDLRGIMEDRDLNLQVSPDELAYTANHILRATRGNVARKTQASPSWDVTPMTAEESDRMAAKVAQQILEHAYETLGVKSMRREMAYWLETCGNAFFYTGWDEQAGRKVEVYRNPLDGSIIPTERMTDRQREMAREAESVDEFYEGSWDVKVVSPFDVRVPHMFKRMKDMPWVIMDERISMDEAWDRYPKHAKDINPDEMVTTADSDYMRRLASLTNGHGFFLTSGGETDDEVVRLQHLWVKPSRRFPDGLYGCRTKTRVLANQPHPRVSDKVEIDYPIIHCRNIHMPGRFWGMSTTEHLIEAQRDYNRARTQEILVRDRIGHPLVLSPKQSQITSTRNDIGVFIEYDRMGGAPVVTPPPPLSGWHEATKDQALNDLQVISAQSEASQGQAPGNVRSGVAIAQLQEQDDEITANSVEELEEAFSEMGNHLLKWFRSKANMERAIKVYGKSQISDVHFFRNVDVDGDYAIRITPGSMKPRSKSASIAYVDALVERGILNPMVPAHRRLILSTYDIGGTDHLHRHEELDRRRARIENEMFTKPGEGPQARFPDVDEFDDHQVHIDEHLLLLKSDEFETMPVIRKVAFKAHIYKHQEAIAMMAQAANLFRSMSGGGQGPGQPAPKGEASQPAQKQPTPGTRGKEPSQ